MQGKKLPLGEGSFRKLYDNYKHSAKRRSLPWLLTVEEAKKLFTSNCYYCGVEPKQVYTRKWSTGNYTYNGIDRLDNHMGYLVENCVSCCGCCNVAKHMMPKQEFLDWIEKVYEHQFRIGAISWNA